jgi:hypothetical protein
MLQLSLDFEARLGIPGQPLGLRLVSTDVRDWKECLYNERMSFQQQILMIWLL